MKSKTIGVDSIEKFDELLGKLREADTIAIDLETSSLKAQPSTYIVGWCFSAEEGVGYYVPVGHDFGDQLDASLVLEKVKPILEDESKTFVFHNAKFDVYFIQRDGIDIPIDRIEDTMLEAYSIGEKFEYFGLDYLVENIYHHLKVKFSELFPKKSGPKNIATVPIETVVHYGGEDADYTLRLHNRFFPRLANHPIYRIERRLWPIVMGIELRGVEVDKAYCSGSVGRIRQMISEVEEIIFSQFKEATGEECRINIGSTKQLTEVLFDKMGIPSRVTTKSGGRSTSEEVLKKLAEDYPVCQNILAFRSMRSNAKVMENMASSWLGEDDHVHTSYNQTGTKSGRFSSADPNIQNISKKKSWTIVDLDGTEKAMFVYPRAAFVAGDDHYLIELDFSAIEYLIIAAEAGEKSVLDAYRSGRDVHIQTASDMYKIPYEEVTSAQRSVAKMMAYLMLYGGSASNMAGRTDLSEAEAEAGFETFFRARAQIVKYMKGIRDRAAVTKSVSTKFGRKQYIPEYDLPGFSMRSRAERLAVNLIIQGTAADIHKIGLIRTKVLENEDQSCILQTHDSQTWRVRRSVKPQDIIPKLIDRMSPEIPGYPRILVGAELGYAWGNLSEYDDAVDYAPLFEEWESQHKELVAGFGSGAGVDSLESAVVDSRKDVFSGPVRIDVDLGIPNLTEESVGLLQSVLGSFPGENVIFVKTESMNEAVALKAVPTRLNVMELRSALKPKFPAVSIDVNRDTLLSAVFGGNDF